MKKKVKIKVKYYTYKNGATLIYKRFPRGNATAIRAGFKCGFVYEENGMPHCFEHMLFKGTSTRTPDEIIKDGDTKGFINAATSEYFMFVNFYESNRRLESSAESAADILFNSTFENEQIKKEIEVVKQERERKRTEKHKSIYFMHEDIFVEQFFKDIDDYCNTRFGTDEFLNSLTTEDFVRFRDKHFTKNKFIMIACSSLPFRKIKKVCDKYFLSKITTDRFEEPIEKQPYPIRAKQGLNIIKNEDKAPDTILTIKMNCDPNDYIFNYSLWFLRRTFLVKPELYHNKLRELGLVYAPYCFVNTFNEGCVTINFKFQTSKQENLEKIFAVIGDSIQILKQGYKQEDVDNFINQWDVENDYPSTSNNEDRVKGMMVSYEDYGTNDPKINLSIKQLRKYVVATTVDDINETINKLFDKNNEIFISVMGDVDKDKFKTIEEYKDLILK